VNLQRKPLMMKNPFHKRRNRKKLSVRKNSS
jgi:hypothetical protein